MTDKQKIVIAVILVALMGLALYFLGKDKKGPLASLNLSKEPEVLTPFEQAVKIAKKIQEITPQGQNPYAVDHPAYSLTQQLNALGYKYVNPNIISPLDNPNEFLVYQ